ncbi:MAG: hypothetical protein K0B08_07675 [Bacteroidales bacterium]|nr:hypothetical protein [Bacteroidales bacterium]
MKTSIIFLMVFMYACAFNSVAQDVIYKKDGTREDVRVILIGEREIQYKKFSNLDGPVYSIDKSNILLITYETGEYELVSKSPRPESTRKQELATDFAKNILSYHAFDVVFGDFTISYERLISSGIIGFKIPVSVGYDYWFADEDYDRHHYGGRNFYSRFFSGAGVNFYPFGQGMFRYFVGPHVRAGHGMELLYDYSWFYDEFGNYYEEVKEIRNEGFYTQFFIDNGMMFTPVKNFSMSVIASFGFRYFPEASYRYDAMRPDGHFAINLSFKF